MAVRDLLNKQVEVAVEPTEAQVKEAVRIMRKANDMTLPMARDYVAKHDVLGILEAVRKGVKQYVLTEQEIANEILVSGVNCFDNYKPAYWVLDRMKNAGIEIEEPVTEEPVVETPADEPVVEDTPADEPAQAEQPAEDSVKLERANKLTIQSEGGVLVARFYRTHKLVKVLDEADLGFESDSEELAQVSKLEVRELFRQQAISRATEFGVEYDPVNRGQASPKFTDMDQLADYAMGAVQEQIRGLDWAVLGVSTDGFSEITRYNGRTVTSKYANGTIAYASGIISLTVVNNQSGAQGMIDVDVLVVSGQYKKPRKFVFKGDEYNMSGAGLSKAMETIVDGASEGK